MEQILYLEVDDDILGIRDRLRRAQSKHVLLVVPAGCQALRRPLDLRLLRRQAAALQLSIALVSGDATLRDLAIAEGLTVFSTLSLGRRVVRRGGRWRTEDLPGADGLTARMRRQRPRWWYWVVGPVAVVLVLATLAWSAWMIWPSATIRVVPAREPIGFSAWIEASPSTRAIDWDRLKMPAQVVQVEVVDRGEVETTGVANVAAGNATGTALFVNATQREANVPIDTIVSTSAGTPVRFHTTQAATVGPRGRVRVSIEALESGPSGNVRAGLINRVEGGLSATLRVTNDTGTGGGTTTQVRRVTHGDKQELTDLLVAKLIQKGHDELSSQLEGEFLPIETMWINDASIRTNFDRNVDEQADTLALEMRAVVGGLAISEESAQEMARRALSRQIRTGFHLLPDTVKISRGDAVQVDTQAGLARFAMDSTALMEADVDVGLLTRAIQGQPLEDAMAYMRLTLPVEVEPVLSVNPDWTTRLPYLSFRIVVVEGERPQETSCALPGP